MVFVYNNYIHQSYIIKIIYTSYYKFDYLYILKKKKNLTIYIMAYMHF